MNVCTPTDDNHNEKYIMASIILKWAYEFVGTLGKTWMNI